MKTKTGLVDLKTYRSSRTVTASWLPVRANDGSPHYVGYVAKPHPHSGDLAVECFGIWSSADGALRDVAQNQEAETLEPTLAKSSISYDTNRPNKSNLCYRAFEGAWFYEPYRYRAVVWPEPQWLLGSTGFRLSRTMFRAAKFRGYPESYAANTTYESEPRNLPTLLEKQSAGRQLAAGPSKGIDGLLTSIIEMKDVPSTIQGLLSFARFVANLRKKPSSLISKATLREIVGIYLNFTYGIVPTISECEKFRDGLLDDLRKARTSIDAMFEAASDSLRSSTRDYRKWLAAHEKRDEEIRIMRENSRRLKMAEREARRLKAKSLKIERDQIKALLETSILSTQQIREDLHLRRTDAYAQLDAEAAVREQLHDLLDDLWSEREAKLLEQHSMIQAVAKQASYTFLELDNFRDLAWFTKLSTQELYDTQMEYDNLLREIDRIKKETEEYKKAMSDYREQVLQQLVDSYSASSDLRSYLQCLSTVEQDIADRQMHIFDLQMNLLDVNSDIERLYAKPQHHSGGRSTRGSTSFTRVYQFPDIYISARRRLHKEPGGVPYMATLGDNGSVSYTVTYRLQGWEITPDPTEEISRLLIDAINRLYRGHMSTVCGESIVYKQWPLEVLSNFFSPYGRLCDFAHSFLQPLKTLWAIAPWSFVADWFADFSATFGAIEAEFTRSVLGLPEADTWSASSFLALLATNLDHSVPVSVEQEWISNPDQLATEHTVRYTFRISTPSEVTLRGATGDAFVRRPEPSGGVAEFLPPPNLSKVFSHAAEGLALLTQQLLK